MRTVRPRRYKGEHSETQVMHSQNRLRRVQRTRTTLTQKSVEKITQDNITGHKRTEKHCTTVFYCHIVI